jgi:hypothetical protein
MDQILKDIGNAISSIFSNEVVQLAFRGIGIYIVIIWLATAFWAYQDMKHRTANPILPYLAAALIVVFTPIFFIFAAILYRIIRPQERIGEAHERMLAEEAMLAEVEQIDHCAGCGRRVVDGWIVCPTCRTRLRRVCPSCGKLVGTDWALCAWCGTDFEVAPRPAAVGARPYGSPSSTPRPAARPAPASLRSMATPAPVAASSVDASTGVGRSPYEPAPDDGGGQAVTPMARAVRSVPPTSAAGAVSPSLTAPVPSPTASLDPLGSTSPTSSDVDPIDDVPAPTSTTRRRATSR